MHSLYTSFLARKQLLQTLKIALKFDKLGSSRQRDYGILYSDVMQERQFDFNIWQANARPVS